MSMPLPRLLDTRIYEMKRSLPGLIVTVLLAASMSGCDGSKTTVIESAPHATAANELAAMTRLTAVARAEMMYQTESGGKFAPLDELIQKGFVNDPTKGKLTGYELEVKVSGNGFQATATPEKFPVTGKRSFYIDEAGVIRGADKRGAHATASDPPL